VTEVRIYRSTVRGDEKHMDQIYTARLERRPEWLGM